MTNLYAEILRKIEAGTCVALRTELDGTEGNAGDGLHRQLTDVALCSDLHHRQRALVRFRPHNDGWQVEEPFFPRERVILLGGGHVSQPICEFAARCGFAVTVCDDREEFVSPERFPEATERVCDSYAGAIEKLGISPYDYVVIVTRGHKSDTDSLRSILRGPAPAYVGMIGSRKRVAEQMKLLKNEGFSKERLEQVCSPIGLDIGALTPAEIAVSIMAEIISWRRLGGRSDVGKPFNDSDVDLPVLSFLAEHTGPKAVVTVLKTTGSSPRKAGARMVVGPEGLLAGTVGGGAGEGALIREAQSLIGTGTYRLTDVDFGGMIAEDADLVCGGSMCVLLEDASE